MENKRKHLFINKQFQANIITKFFGFFYFIYAIFLLIVFTLLGPLFAEISLLNLPPDHGLSVMVANFNFYAFWIAIIAFLALSCFVFIAALLLSHKIAGPIYSIKRTMKEIISEGNLKEAQFREKDFFVDLKDQFNEFIVYLKKK
ncbi:MAG: hypothetical protein A2381_15850 [Bdellovibrionales bacterium RIFOXYB1_FULL_37_110]|nr:MAG: hypothetical protein A2417_07700 [Bdellovibrionales bacterium RIFOXYC1_FULL_37_79]OFZ57088.1 MAG: hypothetical protein A2381_15850 [Bdellovibrionales bacterium RIFOXYB1_FULL_37_110]OFZ62061.1 MAG: hypothetical protein A2577_08380 [Bdellovibrionales bacterium RIFOXYD1_FULL_36_51]